MMIYLLVVVFWFPEGKGTVTQEVRGWKECLEVQEALIKDAQVPTDVKCIATRKGT